MEQLWLPEAGWLLLLLSAVLSAATALMTFNNVRLQRATSWHWVRRGTLVQSALLLLAFVVLLICFLDDNFSVAAVAQHSSRLLPPGLKIAAVWAGHEGSLLLWIVMLAGWSSLFAWRSGETDDALFPLTLALLSVLMAALLALLLTVSDPFARVFPPALAGRDLNPMLQHPGLILHPPLLYLGYGALSVAAAVALASLWRGGFSAAVAFVCWRWALPGWCALTLGITLGSWWAYSELGWGGWWFWDPVENASLLPWLSASALLHALLAARQRGIYRQIAVLLAIVTLILTLLGTLIVRSGILVSVHAFALNNTRAVPLFVLFSVLSLAALAIYGWRARPVSSAARYTGGSREILVLAAVLLLTAVLLIVAVGTLFPLMVNLTGQNRLSVGAPYFNAATLPFGLLLLAGIMLSGGAFWKRTPRWPTWRILATAFGALCGGVAGGLGAGGLAALASALIMAALAALWCQPFPALRRQLPALLAHSGVAIAAAGMVLSSVSREEISRNVTQGEQVGLAGYTFLFQRLDLLAQANYTAERARIAVIKNGKPLGVMTPERRYYTVRRQLSVEPGIHWTPWRDWYVVLGEKTGEKRYAMRFYIQRGVRWIWGGALLMTVGALLSGWRGRRYEH